MVTVNVVVIPIQLFLKYLVLRESVKDIVWHFSFLNNSDDIMTESIKKKSPQFKKNIYAGCHTIAERLT